ncbi:chaperonin 10-like protein [Leucosporidium creatinivorum]|uniref:Chaperonin 10-like protein n=1 Tax=Leucosporidium creatinivorum TaxID=106004 RepID=A0A1Y2FL94_9BASI|nr:chaperonin 10-like protein [Leucosporidium creatinivorum]
MQSHHPKSYMAAQICHKGGKLEMKDVDWKEPRKGEIVVKVIACGVARSDRITQDQLLDGIKYPRTPSHEFVGEICAIGDDVKHLKMKDMVAGSWHGGHCNTCTPCRAGDLACCREREINGVTRDGGMAEYVCIRSEACIMVPKSMDPAEMTALLCHGATIFNSLNTMCVSPGELVGIHGAGGLGKLACDMSRCMGYRTVLIGEGDQLKREMNLGSQSFIDCLKMDVAKELMQMGGAKVILCCLPESKHIPSFIQGLQANGQLCLTTMGHDPRCDMPIAPLIMRRRTLLGCPPPTPLQVEDCLRFCKMHDIRVKVNKMPLKECNKAWEEVGNPDSMRKPVLMMD